MNRPGIVSALEEFKQSVYGENYHEGDDNIGAASKKRKAIADRAIQESANYDWEDLAENGKVKSIFSTFVEWPGAPGCIVQPFLVVPFGSFFTGPAPRQDLPHHFPCEAL